MKQQILNKLITIGLILLIMLIGAYRCPERTATHVSENIPNTSEDSLLAKKLGADERGMRKYFLAFLKRGPNRNQDSTTAAQLQQAHMDNIQKLAKEGKLILAGPFLDDQDLRGIYIFAVETMEEAQALTQSDPAIQAGRLVMDIRPWYGSAALMQVNEVHNRITK